MFDLVLKTPLKTSIKASVSSTFLALASIWLNTFFPLLWKVLFLPIYKNNFKLCCTRLILIQTNIYVKTYTSMQISRCPHDKTMLSDNFKRNFIILIRRKLNMFIFCTIHGHCSFAHFKMLVLKWSRILRRISSRRNEWRFRCEIYLGMRIFICL